jgi:hypothetical protein
MIITGDRAERFALRAFAAARCAKKEKRLIFHAKPAYTAKGTGPASMVIPSEVEGSRGVTGNQSTGSFVPESFRGSR